MRIKFWQGFRFIVPVFCFCFFGRAAAQIAQPAKELINKTDLTVGAEQLDQYLPLIKDKTIGIVANQTSMIGSRHLVDSLLALHVNIKCVFAPEHGFRGNTEAGGKIKSGKDEKTGLPVISLYGKHVKPSASDLSGIQYVIFDIQDVGARFYTYIATLQYIMEACAAKDIPVIILDRPNPNGFYVDGPVMEKSFESFVGLTPIPVVHGLTIAEYAQMLNGEHWLQPAGYSPRRMTIQRGKSKGLNKGIQCRLHIVKVKNYSHTCLYNLPVNPSPNLNSESSVYLYPSLCLFEGTVVSVGRGTDKPFCVIGFPAFKDGNMKFTPKSIKSVAEHPIYEDTLCKGVDLREYGLMYITNFRQINLQWLTGMYKAYPEKKKFFNNYFNRLTGTAKLQRQIIDGVAEDKIRESWKDDITKYKAIRKKYLLYEDFE